MKTLAQRDPIVSLSGTIFARIPPRPLDAKILLLGHIRMPNGAYLHLLINHIPVILAPLGTVALIIAWFTRRRAVWLYAVATLTLAGVSAYPVMATGHAAEHVVRDTVPTVARSTIHEHEEAGEQAMWVLLVSGVAAAYAWWRLGKQPSSAVDTVLPLWLRGVMLLLALGATVAVTHASEEAGYIIHHESHVRM